MYKTLSIALGIAAIALVAMNLQLKQQLVEANKVVTAKSESVGVLKSAVDIQNQAVEEYIVQSDAAIQRGEQALAEAQPVIEEQERRILGIRSAPDSNDPEIVRQKMLKDAMQ